MLSNIQCEGTESTLAECGHIGWYNMDCYVMLNTAGVTCSPYSPSTPGPSTTPIGKMYFYVHHVDPTCHF